jgi:FkbM family methyltransferase
VDRLQIDFQYNAVNFSFSVHPEFLTLKDKDRKTKAFKKAFKNRGISPRDSISSRIYAYKTFYDTPWLEDSLSFVPPNKTIIDCGANIGNHSIFWAVLNKNKVLAFEPLPLNYDLLVENVSLNKCNVIPHKILLGDGSDVSYISHVETRNFGGAMFTPSSSGEWRSQKLDDIVVDEDIAFVKIDVEGMEMSVLKGMQNILSKSHPYLFIEIHKGVDPGEVCNFLKKFNYEHNKCFRTKIRDNKK